MRLPRHPWPWFASFGFWLATLWWLSSRTHETPSGLGFPHADKVAHFGWFFGGAGLLAAAVFCLAPKLSSFKHILLVTIIIGLVGIADEFHQSFTEGRDGNSLSDLIADTLGGLAGACVFRRFRSLLSHDSPTQIV